MGHFHSSFPRCLLNWRYAHFVHYPPYQPDSSITSVSCLHSAGIDFWNHISTPTCPPEVGDGSATAQHEPRYGADDTTACDVKAREKFVCEFDRRNGVAAAQGGQISALRLVRRRLLTGSPTSANKRRRVCEKPTRSGCNRELLGLVCRVPLT